MANTPRELFRAIRETLVKMLKDATIAGQRVRTGIQIPLDNPFQSPVLPEDDFPLIVVGPPRITFSENGPAGNRKNHKRDCRFQIDVYVKHDFTEAESLGIGIDEELEIRRDNITDQVITEIEKNDRFQFEGSLEGEAELWPVDSIPNNYETDNEVIIATNSITVNAMYKMARVMDETKTFSLVHVEINTESILKELEVTLP
jgi:hypothetical protein